MKKTLLRASLIAMLGFVACGNDFMNVNAAEKTLSFVHQKKVNGLIREFDLLDHSDQSKLIAILTERLSSGIRPIDKLSDPEKKSQLPTMHEVSPHADTEVEKLKKQIKRWVELKDIVTVVTDLMPKCVNFSDECNKPVFQWVCEEVLRDNDEAKGEILGELQLGIFGHNHCTIKELKPIIANDNMDAFIKLANNPGVRNRYENSIDKNSLILAALAGSTKVFKHIVMGATSHKDWDWKKLRELFDAALIGGNLEIIRICEQNGVTNMSNIFYEDVAAHRVNACAFLTPDIARWIWEQGFIPREKINKWVIRCAECRNTEVVKRLVKLGVDVNSAKKDDYKDNYTLLMAAAKSENIDLVRYLVEKGANVNAQNYGFTPLHMAVAPQNIDMVKYLVENGANANLHDGSNSPLSKAARLKDMDIVKYLVEEAGAKIRDGDIVAARTMKIKKYLEKKMAKQDAQK